MKMSVCFIKVRTNYVLTIGWFSHTVLPLIYLVPTYYILFITRVAFTVGTTYGLNFMRTEHLFHLFFSSNCWTHPKFITPPERMSVEQFLGWWLLLSADQLGKCFCVCKCMCHIDCYQYLSSKYLTKIT